MSASSAPSGRPPEVDRMDEEDSNTDDNNSHPLPENQAGPSTSVTEAYPGSKALIKPRKSSRMMTKLVDAIRVVGKDNGAPLGGIRNYLLSNSLVSPKTADCKILSTVSDALKKGIVTMGTASDFNWLFRLASAATKRPYKRRQKRKRRCSVKKRKIVKRKVTKRKSARKGRVKRRGRKKARGRSRKSKVCK